MLPVFPASSLDSSILTSVLVGLLIVWFFQETLGWTFSGLVVPGYLATILLVQPSAAAVITVEALVTWGVFAIVSDRIPLSGPWTPLFGRDRFMGFLLISVMIRILLESGGFTILAERAGLRVDQELHAMGLVVVPLMAHAMWRAGFGGVPQVGIPVLLTWAVLAGILLPLSNLSVTSFALTYEDLSADFIVSPRHYVILLLGAAFGSSSNLRWGWDFGGIIVPGLLALCWLQPDRLAATVGEAMVIALLLRLALRSPWLRSANVTGGRPLVLGYVIGYFVKYALGWAFAGTWPGFEVRSLFGFGYLLSTIMALRMVKHGEVFRSLVPALGTSLAAVVAGQALAWGLLRVLPPGTTLVEPAPVAADGERALIEAAWANVGPAPAVDSLARRGVAGLVRGGEGFGGLLVRAQGAPIAVVARVGPFAVADTALALARSLDARAVQLCAPEGEACDRAMRALGATWTVVEVADGDVAAVQVPGKVPASLDLAVLGDAVGSTRLDAGAEHVRIILPEDRRLALAAREYGAVAVGAPAPEGLAVPTGLVGLAPDGELRAMREEVLRPLYRWWQGGSPAALALAAGRAGAFGLEVEADDEAAVLHAPGWLLLLRRGGGPLVVDVPAAAAEPPAWALALSFARGLDAGALVAREKLAAGPVDPASVAVATLLADIGTGARVVTVRGVASSLDPGADVVLSPGRVLGPARPAFAEGIAARLERVGWTVGWFDGSARRRSLGQATSSSRAAAEAAGGPGAHVTVWVQADAARRLYGVDRLDEHAQRRLGPERVAVDLDAAVSGVPGRSAADPVPARASRVVGCDSLLGCRWVVETSAEGRLLLPLLPPAAPAAPADPAAPDAGPPDGAVATPVDLAAFSAGAVRLADPPPAGAP